MPFDNPDEAGGAPPMVSFGVDSITALRAFEWDASAGNEREPKLPAGQLYAGVSTADGKAGYLAVPGMLVKLTFTIADLASITQGNLYAIDTQGRGTTTAGTAFRALESHINSSGSAVDIALWAEVWKPKG